MGTWITVAGSFVIFFGTIAAQFYFKWVPNTEDQKRHVKTALSWLLDALSVGVSIYWLYRCSQQSGPITPEFTVTVSLASANTFFIVVLIVGRRIFGRTDIGIVSLLDRHLDVLDHHKDLLKTNGDHIGQLITLVEKQMDAISYIANDARLSSKTRDYVRNILKQESLEGAEKSRH